MKSSAQADQKQQETTGPSNRGRGRATSGRGGSDDPNPRVRQLAALEERANGGRQAGGVAQLQGVLAQRGVVQRAQPGAIEHAMNSCFVAALINTFTVTRSLKNLLANDDVELNPNAAELQDLLLRAVNTVDAANAGNVSAQWVRNIMVSLHRNGITANATETADVNNVIALVIQRLTDDGANPWAGQPNDNPVSSGVVVWGLDQTLEDAAAHTVQEMQEDLEGLGTIFPNVVHVNRQIGNPNVAPQTFMLHPTDGNPIAYRLRATIERDGGYGGGHFVSYLDRGGQGQEWWKSDDLGPSVTAVNDLRNTGGKDMLRRGITYIYERTGAQAVQQNAPLPMIAPLGQQAQEAFDREYREDWKTVLKARATGRKRSDFSGTEPMDSGKDRLSGHKRSLTSKQNPTSKRSKPWEAEEDLEQEGIGLRDREMITEYDEDSLPVFGDESRMGVVTWNVAHFSDRDIGQVLTAFEEAFQEFSPGAWNEFFETLIPYIAEIKNALNDYRGKSEETLREYKLFRKLQSPEAQVDQILDVIDRLQERLENFDYGTVATRLTQVAARRWREEFRVAQKDPAARPALADSVKGLKDFEGYSKTVKKLFKEIGSLKTRQTLLKRISAGKTKELFDALSSNREGFPQLGLVLELRRALHSVNIATHVNEMFEDNDWLDAMILQEVNDPTLLELMGTSFDVVRGPHLASGGDNPQHEYYPLLLRKGSKAEVKIYTVNTQGEMKETSNDKDYGWNKRKGNYRPIVVYEIQREGDSKPVWIGTVHTTPESDQSGGVAEFHRKEIYQEIRRGLDGLQERAAAEGIPLIIGGDFYLTSEAVVEDIRNVDPNVAETGRRDIRASRTKVNALRDDLQRHLGQVEAVNDLPTAEALRERIKFLDEAMEDEQTLRNFLGLTTRYNIEGLGLSIAQTVSGTNPKRDPLTRWFDLQIADFFLHNEDFQSAAVGILKPTGGMVPVDTEGLRYSKHWQRFSDHFPVGGIFSLEQENLLEHKAFPRPKGSAEDARKLNIRIFAASRLRQQGVNAERRREMLDQLDDDRLLSWAKDFLALRLMELRADDIPEDIDEAIALIQELEEQDEDLLPEDRLFVVSPTDFEPTEDEA